MLVDFLEKTYRTYHLPQYLGLDPLQYVRKFSGQSDHEIVGLVAALLAYGRVEQIRASIERLLALMNSEPSAFVFKTSFSQKKKALAGFKHRFNIGDDFAVLLEAVKKVYADHGSLGSFHAACLDSASGRAMEALDLFSRGLLAAKKNADQSRAGAMTFLLPLTSRGGACKRLHMFMRWMVRPDDGIDLGVWSHITPAQLFIPVDTHVASIGRRLGLSRRRAVDRRMCEEMTEALKKIDPSDPVKYDFSLCHAGMVDFRQLNINQQGSK